MSKIELKQKAIGLRGRGHSVKEIARSLNISLSTSSLWTKSLVLSDAAKKRIEQRQINARAKAAITNKLKKQERERRVVENCDVLRRSNKLTSEEAKIYLSLLYWGEGAKTGNRVTFMNSDPKLMASFIGLLRKGFAVNENKLQGVLHLHSYHDKQKMIDYWSVVTGIKKEKISIYLKKESGITKKEDYKGCFSFRYGDVSTMQEILLIIDRFAKLDYN